MSVIDSKYSEQTKKGFECAHIDECTYLLWLNKIITYYIWSWKNDNRCNSIYDQYHFILMEIDLSKKNRINEINKPNTLLKTLERIYLENCAHCTYVSNSNQCNKEKNQHLT